MHDSLLSLNQSLICQNQTWFPKSEKKLKQYTLYLGRMKIYPLSLGFICLSFAVLVRKETKKDFLSKTITTPWFFQQSVFSSSVTLVLEELSSCSHDWLLQVGVAGSCLREALRASSCMDRGENEGRKFIYIPSRYRSFIYSSVFSSQLDKSVSISWCRAEKMKCVRSFNKD